jgi:hypothetical protein
MPNQRSPEAEERRRLAQIARRQAQDRGQEHLRRAADRAENGRGDRTAEYSQRAELRHERGRGDEYSQRERGDRTAEFEARNSSRTAVGAVAARQIEHALRMRRFEEENREQVLEAVAAFIGRAPQPVGNDSAGGGPPDGGPEEDGGEGEECEEGEEGEEGDQDEERPGQDDDGQAAEQQRQQQAAADRRKAILASLKFWMANAPAPRNVGPPPKPTEEQIQQQVEEFRNKVHHARVVRCAWCAELSVTDADEEPNMLRADDPFLRPAAARRPSSQNPDHDERHSRRGYIKALVDADGMLEVCGTCATAIRSNNASSVWQTAIDFGRVPDCLKDMSEAERAFVAVNRPLCKIIKVTVESGGVAMTHRGHVITFPQDSAEVFGAQSGGLPQRARIADVIGVHFIGPRNLVTTVGGVLRRGPLRARPEKIGAAFEYLVAAHPQYRDRVADAAFNYDAAIEAVVGGALITDAGAAGAPVSDRAAARIAQQDFESADAAEQQRAELVMEGHVAMDLPPESGVSADGDESDVLNWVTRQAETPINEFSNNNDLMGGAFPHIFPTDAFPSKSYPPEREVRHMLDYYDCRFQSEPTFMFVLNNQRLRHGICRNNARVNPLFAEEVKARLSEPGFAERLGAALEVRKSRGRLTGPQAELLTFVRNSIRVPLKKIAFTEGDRAPGAWHIQSLIRCLGMPSFFITVSPSVVDNSLGLRLCVPTEAQVSGLSAKYDYDARSREVFRMPASSAIFFDRFQKCVLEVLLRFRIGTKVTDIEPGEPGAFGRVREVWSATEVQGRTLLHFHVLIWTEFTAQHIFDLARRGLLDEALKHIGDMVTSTMPEEYWKWREQKWADRDHVDAPSLEGALGDQQAYWNCVGRTQHHYQHKPTCEKGAARAVAKMGFAACRLCFARPPSERTRLLMIRKKITGAATFEESIEEVSEEMAQLLVPCPHFACLCAALSYSPAPPLMFAERRPAEEGRATSSIGEIDPATGALRTVRLRRAQMLAEFNETLIRACMSNVNVSFLSSPEAAVGAAGYLTEYVTKGDGDINVATSTLMAAASGEITGHNGPRTLLNRFAMAATAMTETAATTAALAMRGGKRYVTNATFTIIYVRDLLASIPAAGRARLLGAAAEREILLEKRGGAHGGVADPAEHGAEDDGVDIVDALGNLESDGPRDDEERVDMDPDMQLLIDRNHQVTVSKQWENYEFRPPECEFMNAIEFFCCTEEVARKPPPPPPGGEGEGGGDAAAEANADENNEPENGGDADAGGNNNSNNQDEGRVPNPRWRYHPAHPRYESAEIKLRSKFRYPALAGARPPVLPRAGVCGAAAGKLKQEWAWYWAAIVIPWRDHDWWDGCAFEAMELNVRCGLRARMHRDRAIAHFIVRCTWGATTTHMNKTLFTSYRFSHADVLRNRKGRVRRDDTEDGAAENDEAEDNDNCADEEADLERYTALFVALNGPGAVVDERSAREMLKQQYALAVGGALEAAALRGGPPAPSGLAIRTFTDTTAERIMRATKIIDRYGKHGAADEAHESDGDGNGGEGDAAAGDENANNAAPRDNTNAHGRENDNFNDDVPRDCAGHERYAQLNEGQRDFVNTVFDAVVHRDDDGGGTHLFWLEGAAGCGKTFATRVLIETVRRAFDKGAVLAVAYQGNAAVNIELGARTIHNAFGIPINGKSNHKDAPLLRREYPELALLVIEEISMVPAEMFATIEEKLQATYANGRRFGGVVVLTLGDFLQIPPVRGKLLAHAAMRCVAGGGLSEREKIGGMLWRTAVRLRLVAVMRAQDCNAQLERLAEMRRTLSFTREMYNKIGVLDERTIAQDPRWLMHTSLHATNAAKNAAGEMHLRRAALAKGRMVYRWRMPPPRRVARLLSRELVAKLYERVPEMWQCFLEGGNFMVLDNVCVPLGITNGAIGVAHSLYFAADDLAVVRELEETARREQAYEVVLPDGVVPTAIELSFPMPPGVGEDDLRTNGLGTVAGTALGSRWIVPFLPCPLAAVKIPVAAGAEAHAPSITPVGFNMAQAFALTLHKGQGLTIRPVALDLAKPKGRAGGTNMTWEMLYVGISRAPSDADLRVLPVMEGQTVDYLFKMRPNRDTVTYLDDDAWDETGVRVFDGPRPRRPRAKPPAPRPGPAPKAPAAKPPAPPAKHALNKQPVKAPGKQPNQKQNENKNIAARPAPKQKPAAKPPAPAGKPAGKPAPKQAAARRSRDD